MSAQPKSRPAPKVPDRHPQWEKLNLAEMLALPTAYLAIGYANSILSPKGAQAGERLWERGRMPGGAIGNTIGAGIGWIADEVSDFDERGEAISAGCLMTFTGRWITDSSHQHNEIHDIESAQLIECNDCVDATGSSSSGLIAAVGIGRHPTGRDP